MIVALDAGNTRTKWGVLDAEGHMISHGAIGNHELGQLVEESGRWRRCRRIVLSNVAGPDVDGQIAAMSRTLDIPLLRIQSTAAACGVVNRYDRPEQLGTDRWAALVAAWNHYRQACVVATAGTALTVDVLSSQGEFCGGLIVPGFRMMQDALGAGTAGLAKQAGNLDSLPANTGDAVHSGILFAMAGAVERMRQVLKQREGAEPHCLLSGGDADLLVQALPSPAKIADNLVLHGLWLIEREHA